MTTPAFLNGDNPTAQPTACEKPAAPPARKKIASVIIPAYNSEKHIGRCLDALLAQKDAGGEIEILVVDDGSSDGTARLVAQYAIQNPRIRLLSQPNRGPAAARNHGAAEACGTFLLFTDSDCEPQEDWVQQMLKPFAEEPAISAVKGAYKTRQRSVVARFAQLEFEERYRKLATQPEIDFVDTYAMAIRSEAFLDIGGFDTSFPTANNEDVELSYRLSSSGHKIRFNPRAIVYHHHPDTLYAYLKTKFGRAYWRMVVYRSFPEKMGGDSYTPQSLKLQILAAFAVLAALVSIPILSHGLWVAFLGMVAFLLFCTPFVAGAFHCEVLLKAGAWCRRVFRGGFFKAWRRRLAAWLPIQPLANMLHSLARAAGNATNVVARAILALLASRPAAWLQRAAKLLLLGLARGVVALTRAFAWLVTLPFRLLNAAARAIKNVLLWLFGLPPARKLRHWTTALARSPLGMFSATIILLFLRAVVMGLGVLWGLRSRRAVKGRFSEVVFLLIGDAAALSVALLAAPLLVAIASGNWTADPLTLLHSNLDLLPAALPAALGFFAALGLYAPCRGISQVNEFAVLAKAVALLAAITGIYGVAVGSTTILAETLAASITGFVLLNIARTAGRHLAQKLPRARTDDGRPPVLIVGTGEVAALICEKIDATAGGATRIVGLVAERDDAVGTSVAGHMVIGTFDDIGLLIAENDIRDVFVALPSHPQEQVLDIINRHSAREGVRFHVVASVCDLITAQVDMASSDSIPIMLLRNESMALLQIAFKRLFDLAIASILLLTTLPAWIIIIIAIKLDSDGPAIFRQARVGKRGKLFQIYKFRTMKATTERYAYSPEAPGDSRVTRVGAFLRKTSLDELPQLLNVIRGEMSLVGPRPEMPFIVDGYSDWQRQRLAVKPGITGLWQIMGRKDLPLHENLEYDFYYIKNQSLLLDLSILIKTIPVILGHKGAY